MIKITSKNETTAQIIASQNIISQISDSLKFRPDGYMFNPKFKAGINMGYNAGGEKKDPI
jgi:hypothetical protein